MSTAARAAVGVVAIALAIVLFVVLNDEDSGDSPEPATTQEATVPNEPEPEKPERPKPEVATIAVKGGEPVGGVAELSFTKGERIEFVVESDVADHVHLHGYDVFMDIAAGGRVRFDVPATLEGVFEVELEERVVPLAEITVNPG
jgi:hypothetical protein